MCIRRIRRVSAKIQILTHQVWVGLCLWQSHGNAGASSAQHTLVRIWAESCHQCPAHTGEDPGGELPPVPGTHWWGSQRRVRTQCLSCLWIHWSLIPDQPPPSPTHPCANVTPFYLFPDAKTSGKTWLGCLSIYPKCLGFPGGSVGKESTCNAGELGCPWDIQIPCRRKWQPTPVFS